MMPTTATRVASTEISSRLNATSASSSILAARGPIWQSTKCWLSCNSHDPSAPFLPAARAISTCGACDACIRVVIQSRTCARIRFTSSRLRGVGGLRSAVGLGGVGGCIGLTKKWHDNCGVFETLFSAHNFHLRTFSTHAAERSWRQMGDASSSLNDGGAWAASSSHGTAAASSTIIFADTNMKNARNHAFESKN